jgi:hypothetical protein
MVQRRAHLSISIFTTNVGGDDCDQFDVIVIGLQAATFDSPGATASSVLLGSIASSLATQNEMAELATTTCNGDNESDS